MPRSDIVSLTPDSLRKLMRLAGYRADLVKGPADTPLLYSATSGLPFEVRFLNSVSGTANSYADVMLVAGLRIQGAPPPDLFNRWNSAKRFCRLYTVQDYLILAMDLIMIGGVSREHVVGQIELWDRLLQELLSYLRNATVAVATNDAGKGAAPTGAASAA